MSNKYSSKSTDLLERQSAVGEIAVIGLSVVMKAEEEEGACGVVFIRKPVELP